MNKQNATEPLAPADYIFWRFHGPMTPQVMSLITFFKRTPALEALQAGLARATITFPRMRGVMQPGDSPALELLRRVDAADHVRAVYLPPSADREQLLQAINEHFCQPLDPARPLWDALLISNRNPDSVTDDPPDNEVAAVLWRIHHVLADGMGAMAVVHEVCGDERDKAIRPRAPLQLDNSLVARGRKRLAASWRFGRNLVAWSMLRRAPSTLNGASSAERCLTPVCLDRAALRSVMRRFEVTLHEALLAVLTSALRRHHLDHGVSVSRDLHVAVPYAEPPLIRNRLEGNLFGTRIVRLPISEPDPLARIRLIRRYVARAEVDRIDEFFHRLNSWFPSLPVAMQRRRLWDFALRCHAACTILPSRLHKLRLDGQTVEGQHAAAALLNTHGAAFTFLSGGGTVSGVIVCDPRIVSDPDRIRTFLEEGLQELLD